MTHHHLSQDSCQYDGSVGYDTGDKRIQIDSQYPAPYKWICQLKMRLPAQTGISPLLPPPEYEFSNIRPGRFEYGTGFLINIPGSTKCVVLTAGHVLYRFVGFMGSSNYMSELFITFRAAGKTSSVRLGPESMMVHEKFRDFKSREYDFGIIILPDEKLPNDSCGFGFSTLMTDRELLASDLSLFGYPVFNGKENTTMWGSGGHVQSVDDRMLRFTLHTTGGQSGSPVFVWDRGVWTVVGIHVHEEKIAGEVLNAAVRLSTSTMNTIITWIGHEYAGVSLRFDSGHLLSVPREAPKGLGEYAEIETKVEAYITSQSEVLPTLLNVIPVRSFPEGSNRRYSDNLWVIASHDKADTYLSIEELATKNNRGARRYAGTIIASSRLKESPIVNPCCEAVFFSRQCSVPEENTPLGIKSLRFETAGNEPTPVWIQGVQHDLSTLVVVKKVQIQVVAQND